MVVDTLGTHRMRSTIVHKGCGESLEGVDPSRIHRVRSTLVYRGSDQYLRGVDSLQGVR